MQLVFPIRHTMVQNRPLVAENDRLNFEYGPATNHSNTDTRARQDIH